MKKFLWFFWTVIIMVIAVIATIPLMTHDVVIVVILEIAFSIILLIVSYILGAVTTIIDPDSYCVIDNDSRNILYVGSLSDCKVYQSSILEPETSIIQY